LQNCDFFYSFKMMLLIAVSIGRAGSYAILTISALTAIRDQRHGWRTFDMIGKLRRQRMGGGMTVVNYRVVGVAMPEASSAKIVRFGAFEVDLVSGELRKNGTRIRLQEQPFRVLAMLLEQPGEMVAREDLRSKLWPGDTFVDFDHGLNTAVNKLREALGDAAANPRFVQTVARRGYRFIAPVQENGRRGGVGAGEALSPAAPASASHDQRSPAARLHPELEVPVPRRSITRGLFILIQVMYLIFYVAALFRWQAVHRIADGFLPGWNAVAMVSAVLVTAGVGIPLRCYLISGVAFDHRRMGQKFQQLFPAILPLDELWAVAPFLLMGTIGFGAAFAATAALLYVPFSERSLMRLTYPGGQA
jgi:DNA-binding winged helix-turn-helix (wHTH) protein